MSGATAALYRLSFVDGCATQIQSRAVEFDIPGAMSCLDKDRIRVLEFS